MHQCTSTGPTGLATRGRPGLVCRTVRREILSFRPHIVHSHLLPADLIAALAVCGLDVAHISHIRDTRQSLADTGWRNAAKRQVYRYLLRRRTWFISVSQDAKRSTCETLGVLPERVKVVLNGIDLSCFAPPESGHGNRDGDDTLIIGAAGRLTPEKGHRVLLGAARILAAERLSFRIRIAGEGSLREELLMTAATTGLADRVQLLGAVRDMATFYRGLDLFVLPSLSEGLPRAILEAMALGVPVVSSHVGGVAEVIVDGVHGFLVPASDADSLARAIRTVAMDRELRRKVALEGQRHVRSSFSSERVAREVEALYREILDA